MKKARPYIAAALLLLSVWMAVTVSIQRVKCPAMTETELFMAIPKTLILNWQECR